MNEITKKNEMHLIFIALHLLYIGPLCSAQKGSMYYILYLGLLSMEIYNKYA